MQKLKMNPLNVIQKRERERQKGKRVLSIFMPNNNRKELRKSRKSRNLVKGEEVRRAARGRA